MERHSAFVVLLTGRRVAAEWARERFTHQWRDSKRTVIAQTRGEGLNVTRRNDAESRYFTIRNRLLAALPLTPFTIGVATSL